MYKEDYLSTLLLEYDDVFSRDIPSGIFLGNHQLVLDNSHIFKELNFRGIIVVKIGIENSIPCQYFHWKLNKVTNQEGFMELINLL